MRLRIWDQIIEAALISFSAWWMLATERGEKPAAICWLRVVKILHHFNAFITRCVYAAEKAYYRAVTA